MKKFKKIRNYCIKNRWIIFPEAAVLILLIIVLAVLAAGMDSKEVIRGDEYLMQLESKDMDAIEKQVKEVRKAALEEAVEAGEISVWARFTDYVIFGDSRTVGFYYHEFLERQRVIAEGGLTIADIADYEDQMAALNPAYLFLCTGLNDVSIGYWKTPEEYVEAYEEVVEELQSKLPDTQICINSIFPAQDPAFEKSSKWREIPDYNTAVKAWCEEKGYTYIDNTDVYESHNDLYDEDGIHFKKEFYEYWALNMLEEVDL